MYGDSPNTVTLQGGKPMPVNGHEGQDIWDAGNMLA